VDTPDGYDEFLKAMERITEVSNGIEPQKQEIVRKLVSAKGMEKPVKLYHYSSLYGVEGIIQSNHLWATDFRCLNDSSELFYGAELLSKELVKYGESLPKPEASVVNKLAGYFKDHHEEYRNFLETYVVSLTEDPDVLSQWRAYADSAKGHCIEFDFSDSDLFTIISAETPWAMEILPVIYDKEHQKELIASGIKQLIGYLNSTEWTLEKISGATETEQGSIMGLLMHAFDPFIIAFKHPGFAEEREWRAIVACANNLTDGRRKKRETDYGESHYVECIFIQGDEHRLWQRERLPITGIIHGPLAPDGAIERLRQHIDMHGYSSDVAFSESSIPLRG
tara:strand:+ start:36 stop:1046 length:1011 start_codon:yes stop_codon:yes gene_type:complete